MNCSILDAFIADQRRAKSIVADKLGVPVDIPALEWSLRHNEICEAYASKPFADAFTPHGYGLEFQTGDLYIDYDYSERGRPDGFDAWRIFVYLLAGDYDCNGPDDHLQERVSRWFETLVRTRKIEQLDNLYYLRADTH